MNIEGLNNSQRDKILEWFGLKSPRGVYFTAPMVFNIALALVYWHVKTVDRRDHERPEHGFKV
jgi:hypothetical protein